jgi:hypothetical protein
LGLVLISCLTFYLAATPNQAAASTSKSTTSYATLAPSHLAAAVGGAVSDLAAAVYCSVGKVLGFDPCAPAPASAAPAETQAAAVPSTALPPSAPSAPTSATTTPTTTTERVVTERVIERTAPTYLTDTSKPGSYVIEYRAIDPSGNLATSSRTVIVRAANDDIAAASTPAATTTATAGH